MKTKTYFALVAVFGFLVSCTAIRPHPMDMTQAVQSAKTRSDHEALAKHYEDAAKEIGVKVEEHRKVLAQYQTSRGIYLGYTRLFTNHHQALIYAYEHAVAANMSMAESHRQMAAEAK